MRNTTNSIIPVAAVRMPPPESRTAPDGYKEDFDADIALATAESLRSYLVGLATAEGCNVEVSGAGRSIECRCDLETSLRIEVFGDDVFDMFYGPSPEQMLAREDRAILQLLMPGFDSDHVAAYARHYLSTGKLEI